MADEPAYLKMLRRDRATRAGSRSSGGGGQEVLTQWTIQEREAIRWAKEVSGGASLRSINALAGSRYAVVLKISSAAGMTYFSLEGLATRDRLLERLRPGAGMGEDILGAYEVKGGRPITFSTAGSEVSLALGTPRPGANPLPPEKMLRKAMVEAEQRARSRGPRSR